MNEPSESYNINGSINLPVPIPVEEKKLSKIFIFTLHCGASKGFMPQKPFEAP